jgi:cytochrome oxidase Cu insertion factor (SCO1/SenC/PrrC family)
VDIRKLVSIAFAAVTFILAPALYANDLGDADAEQERARNYFTNLEVIDQDGRKLKFYDDVLRDQFHLY